MLMLMLASTKDLTYPRTKNTNYHETSVRGCCWKCKPGRNWEVNLMLCYAYAVRTNSLTYLHTKISAIMQDQLEDMLQIIAWLQTHLMVMPAFVDH
eukprot:1316913-Karenia_brevis.AAC.1